MVLVTLVNHCNGLFAVERLKTVRQFKSTLPSHSQEAIGPSHIKVQLIQSIHRSPILESMYHMVGLHRHASEQRDQNRRPYQYRPTSALHASLRSDSNVYARYTIRSSRKSNRQTPISLAPFIALIGFSRRVEHASCAETLLRGLPFVFLIYAKGGKFFVFPRPIPTICTP